MTAAAMGPTIDGHIALAIRSAESSSASSATAMTTVGSSSSSRLKRLELLVESTRGVLMVGDLRLQKCHGLLHLLDLGLELLLGFGCTSG